MTASLRGKRRNYPLPPDKLAALDAVIRKHWGKITALEIANIAGETPSAVSNRAARIGMPRLTCGTMGHLRPLTIRWSAPKGYADETIKWARKNAAADREAAMILAHHGEDVRHLGHR